ncbi:MAG TPA: zinc ribbon domain-containing protein [Natrialbaceae archaeon]|nr:zinc ribbon domain-containing protein [Natrialbaceae archaeon]
MLPDLPSASVFAALGGFNLVVLTYLLIRWRTAGKSAIWPAARATGSDRVEGATIECSECGAPNDPEYRFCRRCVADLSPPATDDRRTTDLDGQES